MLVLDGSGSMAATDFPDGAPSRMDRMRVALANVLPGVSRGRRLGLVVYAQGGHENSCENVELKFAPRANAAAAIFKAAERMRPGGRTPLAQSVSMAFEALKDSPRPSEIVVLTDGEDTCGGDPCALARSIAATAPGITVHVIGFRLPSNSETEGARCLADVTGGKFVTAESTDALSDALRQTLSCPQLTDGDGRGKRRLAFGAGGKRAGAFGKNGYLRGDE